MEAEKLDIEDSVVVGNYRREIKNVYGIRHILAILSFSAMLCLFTMRVNLSVAIVAMVGKHHGETFRNASDTLESCPFPQSKDHGDNFTSNVVGEFQWNEKTQGMILGSLYYSQGFASIIGGRTSDYFGGRILVGVGMLISAFLSFLTPMLSRMGYEFLIAVRIVEGFFQGVIIPSISKLITKWFTTEEKSKFTGFIFGGIDLGCVVTFSASGWLIESGFLGGWPSVFYVPGMLTIVWSIFWFLLIRDEPRKHPRISKEELKYILEGCTHSEHRLPVPWAAILSSKYFWTITSTHFGLGFGYFVLLSELPTYLANILHVPINNNGLMSSMPYLASWICCLIYSVSIDKAIKSGKMTILSVRRLSVAISGYIPMLCLIGMCFVNCSITGAFTLLLISGASNGAVYGGVFSSYSDLSPKFAGTLMGFGVAFGTTAGFLGPAITGIITQGNQTIPAWRTVFIICAIIYGISTTIYEIFITTEIQPWNEPKKIKLKLENEESCVGENFLQKIEKI